ncbi:uncharacterized protein LOC131065690 [Cryptomeria japonica]|uniref:uncharacterized protein LOC131065690 n=1 Tax=Cryptomeria japonica TaxID=3369 RepID=UPI0025ABDB55|nr:uncharacterized protein LOC131065690 [Cryptomeria japonica]
MASTSGISTPLLVEITERARPIFKKYSFKSVEDDLNGAFSSVSYGVLHNEDIRAYIHCNIKELGNADMLSLYTKHMMDEMGNLKLEFKSLQDKILKEDKKYDLCGALLSELMRNVKKIKQDKKHVFKFGSLIVCLAFYFLNEIPSIEKVQWDYDEPVAVQIKEGLQGLGDVVAQKSALWGYFKSFQAMSQSRERIPKDIVEKYEDTICYMMDKDQCHMEKEERFGTYKEKDLDLHKKFTEPERKSKVKKEIEELAEKTGITKEVVQSAREENIMKEEDMVKTKKKKLVSTPHRVVKKPQFGVAQPSKKSRIKVEPFGRDRSCRKPKSELDEALKSSKVKVEVDRLLKLAKDKFRSKKRVNKIMLKKIDEVVNETKAILKQFLKEHKYDEDQPEKSIHAEQINEQTIVEDDTDTAKVNDFGEVKQDPPVIKIDFVKVAEEIGKVDDGKVEVDAEKDKDVVKDARVEMLATLTQAKVTEELLKYHYEDKESIPLVANVLEKFFPSFKCDSTDTPSDEIINANQNSFLTLENKAGATKTRLEGVENTLKKIGEKSHKILKATSTCMKGLISKLENDHRDKASIGIIDMKEDTPDDKETGLGRRTRVSTRKLQSQSKEIEDIKQVADNIEQLELEAVEMLQNLT